MSEANHMAAVFPGQGSQSVGMGRTVFESSIVARRVFDDANRILGFDIAHICFEGPAEKLEQTDIQQPAIFVVSVALWEALLEAGARRENFSRMGGLSLGEYTALYASGAVAFEDALRLVAERGRLMQQAALAAPSGMAALIGADEGMANELCHRARGSDVLAPANFNCPGQIVISGSRAAIDRALILAGEVGCRATSLPVAGAFHSPIMSPAATGLRKSLDATRFESPSVPVIANVNADYHGDASSIRDWLEAQLVKPVLWQKCVERMLSEGVTRFVEIGPGRALTGFLRKIRRDAKGIVVNGPEGVTEAVEALRGAAV